MKLICCRSCFDVVKLQLEMRRTCLCQASAGQYLSDHLHVEVSGPCFVLGLSNFLLSFAIHKPGTDVTLSVIHPDCDTVKRIL